MRRGWTGALWWRMVELSESTFTEYTAGELAVIDFWAEWCGPCKTLAPAFAQAANNLGGQAKFAKLNVDEAPAVAAAHQVMSIPTIIVMRDGAEVGRIVGARGGAQLEREIESLLA